MKLYKKIVLVFIASITIILFTLAISTRTYIRYGGSYNNKNKVVLYLYRYDELPDNYINKNQWDHDYKLLLDGYNVGGDIFRYEGSIVNYTNYQNLRECDLYSDRQEIYDSKKRGTNRLVFSIENDKVKEVFYTSDHYQTFEYISYSSINGFSSTCFIIFMISILGQTVYFAFIYSKNNKFDKGTVKFIFKTYGQGFVWIFMIVPFGIYYGITKIKENRLKRIEQ